MRLNDIYNDRGIQKYSGFYLSEHTNKLDYSEIERNRFFEGRVQMSEELIFQIIDFAIFKNKKLSIQLNVKDIEGSFFDDVIGKVRGYDENEIFLDDIKIPISQIRNIIELEDLNWYKSQKKPH